MALVLAATGLFLFLRLESELDKSIDDNLRSRASGAITTPLSSRLARCLSSSEF